MTIRIARPPHEDLRFVIGVFLDGRRCADVQPGDTIRLRGDGRAQQLIARVPNVDLSADVTVTDPGDTREIGVAVSYRKMRGRLLGRHQPLTVEVVPGPADPAELVALLENDPEAMGAWTATSGALKSLYSGYVAQPRRRKERLARAAATAYWAKEGALERNVQRPTWIQALGSLDAPWGL